jgi:hypothetical protein
MFYDINHDVYFKIVYSFHIGSRKIRLNDLKIIR